MNVGGFAYHALASRRLGVDEYGALYALISVYQITAMPISILTPVIAKVSAEFAALHDDGHVRGLIDLILVTFGVLGLLYVILGSVFSLPIGSFLHLPWWVIPIVGIMAALGTISGAFRAIAQGVHQYGSYSASMITEGVSKVAALALLGLTGLTVFRGGLAFAAGLLLGGVAIVYPLFRRYASERAFKVVLDWKRIAATTGAAASVTLTVTVIGFADVIVVKHFFSAADAGLYSATSLCARILFYFVGFVPAILIPQATHRHSRGERTRVTLWSAIAFVGITALIGVIAYRFLGVIVLHLLVGRAFDGALSILPTYAGAMGLLALTSTIGSYALATHRLSFAVPLLAGTAATIVAIILVHPSLAVVADELLLGNMLMLATVAAPLSIQAAREQRR